MSNKETPPESSEIPLRQKPGDTNDYSIKAADFDINGTGRVKIGHEFNSNMAHHGDQINHIYHGEPPTRREFNFMCKKTKAELQTEFIEAIRLKKSRRLALALEAGADPDLTDDETGTTPLMVAVECDNVEAVKLLLSMEVNLEAISKNEGFSAMCFAAEEGNTQLLRLLKDHGASVDGVRNQMVTPLEAAIYQDGLDAIDTLLELGADPDHRGLQEEPPLQMICEMGSNGNYPSIVKRLLNAGSRTNVRNKRGHTPLDIVIIKLGLAGTQSAQDRKFYLSRLKDEKTDPEADWEVLQYLVEATRSSMSQNTTMEDH